MLRYLKGTIDYNLCLGDNSDSLILNGYVDSDWAGDQTDRKSTSGYLFMIDKSTISWNSRKQQTVALSTTEAEYIAASAATQEAIWLRHLLSGLGIFQNDPSVIFEDNQSCIQVAKHPKSHSRTKHIDIRHHFLRDKIEQKEIKLEYVSTTENLADILTKPLSSPKFSELTNQIGVKLMDSSLR